MSKFKTTTIDSLIKELLKMKDKGYENVEVKGTVMVHHNVIISTEKQM